MAVMFAAFLKFSKVLKVNPNDGFAKSHLGFIIKTIDLNYKEAIPLLDDGVHSGVQDADHGRFYFHLGDALTRVGRPEEVSLVLIKKWSMVSVCL